MDKLNAALMSACRLEQFPLLCRLHMLELLELRSMAWQSNPTLDHYYRQKLAQIEGDSRPDQSKTAPVQSTVVNPFAFRASYQEGDGGRESVSPTTTSTPLWLRPPITETQWSQTHVIPMTSRSMFPVTVIGVISRDLL